MSSLITFSKQPGAIWDFHHTCLTTYLYLIPRLGMSESILPLPPCIFIACTRITLSLPISCLFRLQLFFCRKDDGIWKSQKTCHSISVYAELRCKLPRFLYLSKSHNFQCQLFTECLFHFRVFVLANGAWNLTAGWLPYILCASMT